MRLDNRSTPIGQNLSIDEQIAEIEARCADIYGGRKHLRQWLEEAPPEMRMFEQVIIAADTVRERFAKRAPFIFTPILPDEEEGSRFIFGLWVQRRGFLSDEQVEEIWNEVRSKLGVEPSMSVR